MLEIDFCVNSAAVEGIVDRYGHKSKEMGEEKSVSRGGARTKVKGHKYELTKNSFFHSDYFKFCLKKKHNITKLFPDTTVF